MLTKVFTESTMIVIISPTAALRVLVLPEASNFRTKGASIAMFERSMEIRSSIAESLHASAKFEVSHVEPIVMSMKNGYTLRATEALQRLLI